MKTLIDLIADSPKAVMLGILLLTVIAASSLIDSQGQFNIAVDPTIDRLLPANDENRQYYQSVEALFGGDAAIIAAVPVDDAFTAESAKRISAVAARLSSFKDVRQVFSLASVPVVRGNDVDLEIRPVTDMLIRHPGDSEAFRNQIMSDPLFRGTVVSPDARTVSFVVLPVELTDQQLIAGDLIGRIRGAISESGGFSEVWVTGTPVLKVATTEALVREMARTLPTIVIIVAVFLLAAFRSLRAVILPIATIALALVWTLGLLGWMNIPLNLVTSIVPPLIITLGLAYGMHVVSEYFAVRAESEVVDVRLVLGKVGLPLVITGLTTGAGFMALVVNPLPAIREFAVVSTVGVLFTVLLSLTFLPAAMQWMGCSGDHGAPGEKLITQMARVLAAFNVRRRKVVLGAGAIVFVISVIGMFQIEVGSENVESFGENTVVRLDYNAINERLGGANVFSVVIDGQVRDAFIDPVNLKAVARLQEWLITQSEIGGSTSIVDHLKSINRSLNDGDLTYNVLPSDGSVIKQLLVFGGGEELSSVVDKRFQTTRITVRATVDDTRSVAAVVDRIEQQLAALPEPLKGVLRAEAF